MKNWTTRFLALAAVATLMGSALIVGCTGGAEEDDAPVANRPAAGAESDD